MDLCSRVLYREQAGATSAAEPSQNASPSSPGLSRFGRMHAGLPASEQRVPAPDEGPSSMLPTPAEARQVITQTIESTRTSERIQAKWLLCLLYKFQQTERIAATATHHGKAAVAQRISRIQTSFKVLGQVSFWKRRSESLLAGQTE